MNYKSTIKKGEPMPSICEICSSINRCNGSKLSETPQENPCFIDKLSEKGLEKMNPEVLDRILSYQPFTNSKRKVKTICGNFAHVRSITYR